MLSRRSRVVDYLAVERSADDLIVLPLSAAGNVMALPIMPAPITVITAIFIFPFKLKNQMFPEVSFISRFRSSG